MSKPFYLVSMKDAKVVNRDILDALRSQLSVLDYYIAISNPNFHHDSCLKSILDTIGISYTQRIIRKHSSQKNVYLLKSKEDWDLFRLSANISGDISDIILYHFSKFELQVYDAMVNAYNAHMRKKPQKYVTLSEFEKLYPDRWISK